MPSLSKADVFLSCLRFDLALGPLPDLIASFAGISLRQMIHPLIEVRIDFCSLAVALLVYSVVAMACDSAVHETNPWVLAHRGQNLSNLIEA